MGEGQPSSSSPRSLPLPAPQTWPTHRPTSKLDQLERLLLLPTLGHLAVDPLECRLGVARPVLVVEVVVPLARLALKPERSDRIHDGRHGGTGEELAGGAKNDGLC